MVVLLGTWGSGPEGQMQVVMLIVSQTTQSHTGTYVVPSIGLSISFDHSKACNLYIFVTLIHLFLF